MYRTPLLVVALLAGGCVLGPTATTQPTTQRDRSFLPQDVTLTGSPDDPVEGQRQPSGVLDMDVFLVDVPAGSISGDAAFWRLVDEDAVGAAAGRRLAANGIRCGVAPRAQWPRFAAIVDAQASSSRRTQTGGNADAQSVELNLNQPVDREDVFVITPDGQLSGHTYDHAVNGVRMTFGPTPRVAESIRLSFCPTVKRDQRRMDFTPLNQELERDQTDTLRIYDAGVTADVPTSGFFILAPGSLATSNPDCLGGRFLIHHDAAAEREQVILALPRFTPLNGTTVRTHAER